jgi:uncharacterized protein YacL
MIFKDISNFNNLNDYLPILNGCINADLIIISFLFQGVIHSSYLKKWYKKFQLLAVITDVLILFIGIIITRFLYSYLFSTFSIWKFIILAIFVQIIHDLIFSWFFRIVPKGYNYILDFFKEYAKDSGFKAILGNSFVIILACLLSSYFSYYSLNINIITLIISLYFIPYTLNYGELK